MFWEWGLFESLRAKSFCSEAKEEGLRSRSLRPARRFRLNGLVVFSKRLNREHGAIGLPLLLSVTVRAQGESTVLSMHTGNMSFGIEILRLRQNRRKSGRMNWISEI